MIQPSREGRTITLCGFLSSGWETAFITIYSCCPTAQHFFILTPRVLIHIQIFSILTITHLSWVHHLAKFLYNNFKDIHIFMFLETPFWKGSLAYGVWLPTDGKVDLQTYFRCGSFNCLPLDMVLPLHERKNYADEEQSLQLESHGGNVKSHREISSDPVQREEDSVPVTGIKDNIRMHLMFIGKHFSLESHGHFALWIIHYNILS